MTRVQKVVLKLHSELASKNILEVACGCGEFSIAASAFAETVHAVDLDAVRLLPEAKNIHNLQFQRMDASHMTYGCRSFDSVVMYNAIGHLADIAEDVLAECLRVLKNDGSLFIVSSFSMDKRFMNTVLIPYLKETSLEFEASEDAPFMYVKVKHKKSPLDKKTSSCKVF
jgi:ubiquinone/menaquinone biosynthesis C-methylase UbiE